MVGVHLAVKVLVDVAIGVVLLLLALAAFYVTIWFMGTTGGGCPLSI